MLSINATISLHTLLHYTHDETSLSHCIMEKWSNCDNYSWMVTENRFAGPYILAIKKYVFPRNQCRLYSIYVSDLLGHHCLRNDGII